MTSRELNRKWNPEGIAIEYQGYQLHQCTMQRCWVVYSMKHGFATRCWSLEEADEEAQVIKRQSDEIETR